VRIQPWPVNRQIRAESSFEGNKAVKGRHCPGQVGMLASVIGSWTIKNFKSIKEAHLDLAPLTLFAGANSSGKSTLLQSILLIAQTLAARGTTQTVVLNGHVVKLGQFDDLRNDASKEDSIEISWAIRPDVEDQTTVRFRRSANRIESLSCGLVFGLSDEKHKAEQLNPILKQFTLTCVLKQSAEEDSILSSIGMTRRKSPKLEEELTVPQRAQVRVNFLIKIELDGASLEELREAYPDAQPIGCVLNAFLPGSLVVRFDGRRELVKAMLGFISGSNRTKYTRSLANSRVTIPEKLMSELRQWLSGPADLFPVEGESDHAPLMSVQEFFEHARGIRRRSVLTPEMEARIEEVALSELPDSPELANVSLPGESLGEAVDYTRDFFIRQIRYLGPLREEPKALYPLQSTADPQDVGLHGEQTAAVLHRFRLAEVRYVPTSHFIEKRTELDVRQTTLEEAVFDWLRYLDVARDVDTADEGKFGYGLRVKMQGSEISHDLTHVGVGVSQVLPIVVMCLLANRDTTIVLEQPELHLNPKVQTRLADFFLSMALLHKQCLIETHSEYLINRLRLRAAEASGRSVSDLMKLYFVEKAGSFTTYRDVVINEFGTILRWPKGFFDQSQREIEDILLAADRKGT
jgi:predicted ATPase